MEARRYRYYEVWASRVRVLETGYFAPMLSHQTIPPDKEWADHLSADLITPHFTISELEAFGRRLRSNYLWIFILLALSWTLKVYIHPFPAPTLDAFIQRAQVGLAPGWMVIFFGMLFNALLFILAIATMRLKDASSEVQPLENFEWHPLNKFPIGLKQIFGGEIQSVGLKKRAREFVRFKPIQKIFIQQLAKTLSKIYFYKFGK